LIYLAFLPFHAWALAVLAGASAFALMLLGRPGDEVQADTVVGVAVGAMAAWTGIQVKRVLPGRSVPPARRQAEGAEAMSVVILLSGGPGTGSAPRRSLPAALFTKTCDAASPRRAQCSQRR
jgi:hypothetical protein